MRTMIDGSTVNMRESPDRIVLSMQARAIAEPVAVQLLHLPRQQADLTGPENLGVAFR
jgi:hypothetical protein